jgi:hypothetical protein
METPPGISLHSYLYLKLATMPCFSSKKLENRRVEQVLSRSGGLAVAVVWR